MNIEEVESQFSKNLSSGLSLKHSLDEFGYAVPLQRQPHVTLPDAKGRKKKRHASADNWSPESGQIVVRYESIPQEDKRLDSQSFRGIGNASRLKIGSHLNRLLMARHQCTPQKCTAQKCTPP